MKIQVGFFKDLTFFWFRDFKDFLSNVCSKPHKTAVEPIVLTKKIFDFFFLLEKTVKMTCWKMRKFWHKGKHCQKYWWQSDLMWIVSVFNENWSNKCGGAPAFTYSYLHEWVPNRKLTISHLLSYFYLIEVEVDYFSFERENEVHD